MANISRYIPSISRPSRFEPLRSFDPFRNIEEMMENFWMRPMFGEMGVSPQIRIDMTETDQAYTLRAEIPGAKKEDIKVALDGNRVSISAEVKEEAEKKGERMICHERYQGACSRSLMLDSDVDEAKAQAKYTDGVLELTLPKKAGAAGAKQVHIM